MWHRGTKKRALRRLRPAKRALRLVRSAKRRSHDHVAFAQYESRGAAEVYSGSHEGTRPHARFRRSREDLIYRKLQSVPGGDLLDLGCGPGAMVRALLESRPTDFHIAAIDRSPAMAQACARQAAEVGGVHVLVGRAETLPFPDAGFDVVLAMGSLEYAEVNAALREISRVTRPGSLILVTMLNPVSPYRIVEWYIHAPLLRVFHSIKSDRKLPHGPLFGPGAGGIRAYREKTLLRKFREARLRPLDVTYFDMVLLVRRWTPDSGSLLRWVERSSLRKWVASAYLLAGEKAGAA